MTFSIGDIVKHDVYGIGYIIETYKVDDVCYATMELFKPSQYLGGATRTNHIMLHRLTAVHMVPHDNTPI